MSRHPMARVLLLATASVLLAACSPNGLLRSGSSQEALKERAAERWQLLINKQADKAWDYLTPGYRKTIDMISYAYRMNHRPVTWTSVKVDKLECSDAERCTVHVDVGYRMVMPRTGGAEVKASAPLKETWLLLDSQWYYLPGNKGGL